MVAWTYLHYNRAKTGTQTADDERSGFRDAVVKTTKIPLKTPQNAPLATPQNAPLATPQNTPWQLRKIPQKISSGG